jgi:dihydroneopterin aldolase
VSVEADRVELRGLRLSGICGVLPEEQVRAQPLEQVVADGRPQLLEHLAEQLAAAVLALGGIDEVEVAVRKLRPPVPQLLATSGVRITRRAA